MWVVRWNDGVAIPGNFSLLIGHHSVDVWRYLISQRSRCLINFRDGRSAGPLCHPRVRQLLIGSHHLCAGEWQIICGGGGGVALLKLSDSPRDAYLPSHLSAAYATSPFIHSETRHSLRASNCAANSWMDAGRPSPRSSSSCRRPPAVDGFHRRAAAVSRVRRRTAGLQTMLPAGIDPSNLPLYRDLDQSAVAASDLWRHHKLLRTTL